MSEAKTRRRRRAAANAQDFAEVDRTLNGALGECYKGRNRRAVGPGKRKKWKGERRA